jgi:hypothetical protein
VLADDGRDGHDMVGFKRVLQAKEESVCERRGYACIHG